MRQRSGSTVCRSGAASGRIANARGDRLAEQMTALYRLPFEKFARYSPYGGAEEVADALGPYLRMGCRSFNLIAVADDPERTVEAASAVRNLLRARTP